MKQMFSSIPFCIRLCHIGLGDVEQASRPAPESIIVAVVSLAQAVRVINTKSPGVLMVF